MDWLYNKRKQKKCQPALCFRKRMARLLEALTCSYSGSLRLAGEGSYLAKSPLIRGFSLEAWCWSTGIAVPFRVHSHDSRICVALNKRRFYKTPERTTVCFASFVCASFFIFIFVFPSSLLCFFLSFIYSFVPFSTPPPFSSSSCVPLYFFLFYSLFYIKLLSYERFLHFLSNQQNIFNRTSFILFRVWEETGLLLEVL
jgi:hypothetical protein